MGGLYLDDRVPLLQGLCLPYALWLPLANSSLLVGNLIALEDSAFDLARVCVCVCMREYDAVLDPWGAHAQGTWSGVWPTGNLSLAMTVSQSP